jgi:UPF0755 protein
LTGRPRRSDPTVEVEEKSSRTLIRLLRLALFLIAVVSCLAAGVFLYTRWQSARLAQIAPDDGGGNHLNPLQALYLRGYLAARAGDLTGPAATSDTQGAFTVTSGERADEVAANLVAAGFLADSELFLNYLRYYDLDSGLEAGVYELEAGTTIPGLAAILSRAVDQQIDLTFIEGWRLEEMAAYLAQIRPAAIDPDTFLAISRGQTDFDLSAYEFLASLPDGASLEGFLFPDTYRIPVEADAAFLIGLMLENFGLKVNASMRQSFGAQGLSVYQSVTLASIVQREAVLGEERPLMVGVFLNRLAQGMMLQADPTVQYAVGYQPESGRWWKTPLTQADLEVDSPYNTYRYEGLPPGPIASPGLEALQAVAQPDQTDYLFFVVDCTAERAGQHVFSRTFDEHLANVEACR